MNRAPAPLCFRLREYLSLSWLVLKLAVNEQRTSFKVYVFPAEPERFAYPHAGRHEQDPQGVEAFVFGPLDERFHLLRREWLYFLRGKARRHHKVQRIVCNPSFLHCLPKRGPQYAVRLVRGVPGKLRLTELEVRVLYVGMPQSV